MGQSNLQTCVANLNGCCQPKFKHYPGDQIQALFSRRLYIIDFLTLFFPKKHTRATKISNPNSYFIPMDNFEVGKHIATMCVSSQESSGKSVSSMAKSIISMCSRTWSQERRNGVLLRIIESPLSVWDCVPEYVIDSHLKDAVYEARFWLIPPLLTLLV